MSLVLISCGSKKRVSDSYVNKNIAEVIERTIDETIRNRIVEIKTSDLNMDIKFVKKEFDTKAEGNPMVSETVWDVNINAKDSVSMSDTTNVKKRVQEYDRTISDIQERVTVEDSSKESRWPVVWITAGVLAMMLVVVYVLRKLKVL